MQIAWNEVAKSVIANVITGILIGGVAAYILFTVTFRRHEDRISELERHPFLTFRGHFTGESEAQALVAVPQGQNAILLISANGYGASASSQFRASIVVRIEVDGNTIARELIWIPQYLYDPVKFGTEPKGDLKLTEEQTAIQRAFPLVATPIRRLERMGPIELAASTSSIITLDEGNHKVRAVCEGDDITSRHVILEYVDIRNSSVGPKTPGKD